MERGILLPNTLLFRLPDMVPDSVVQRQKWLMTEDGGSLTEDQAYDKARKEFYEARHYDEIERRVAREEAMSTGAYFGKSQLQIGMELENQTFEKWKEWAHQQVMLQEQAKSAAYTGIGTQSAVGDQNDSNINTIDGVVDEIDALVPDSARNQEA